MYFLRKFKEYSDKTNNFDRLFRNLLFLQFNNFIVKMRIYCWGYYASGKISGPSNAVAISAGSLTYGSHSCVRFADGTLQCEGVPVSGITTAIAVSTGRAHTCAALSGGTLQCWGANQDGQLGNGTTTSSNVPVTVSGISNAISVSAGSAYTCERSPI